MRWYYAGYTVIVFAFIGCAMTQQTPDALEVPVAMSVQAENETRASNKSHLQTESQDTREKYSGLIYGEDHAYFLTEPDGWVLDNESGTSQGLHAVFYPEGSSWRNSDTVMYSRAVARPESDDPIQAQVNLTIEAFRENGSSASRAEFHKTITTESGETGKIYYFTGDQWNNYEAVAYFLAPETINFIVLTCRNRDIFETSLPAFESVAESYGFVSENVQLTGDVVPESGTGQATTSAEEQTIPGQANEFRVPKGIVYKPADDATNARFRKRLETVFAPDYSGNDLIFDETVVCGPFLWKDLLKAQVMDPDTGFPVIMVVPQGKEAIELKARGIKPRAAIDTLETYIRTLLAEDGGFTVRKLNPNEMSIYWSMIPYDIEEPVFILDSRNHTMLVDFAGYSILHVDDYQDITLDR